MGLRNCFYSLVTVKEENDDDDDDDNNNNSNNNNNNNNSNNNINNNNSNNKNMKAEHNKFDFAPSIRHHPFSMYAHFFEKLAFLTA